MLIHGNSNCLLDRFTYSIIFLRFFVQSYFAKLFFTTRYSIQDGTVEILFTKKLEARVFEESVSVILH